MIRLDGAIGEGGGQVLRTALTLSCITAVPFTITNIRARRKKPGLRPQHLKAVQAAGEIAQARVQGARTGASELIFQPGKLRGGDFRFDIGTAGATSLVLQTVLLPLCLVGRASTVTITGGTHVPWSPSFHYLQWQWLPFLQKMGVRAQVFLDLAGFYPQGGGRIHANIQPAGQLHPLQLRERGALRAIHCLSMTANLPEHVLRRQADRVAQRLGKTYPLRIETAQVKSRFKGTMLLLLAEFESGQACYFGLGKRGKPAEKVADEALDALERFMSTQATVDQYLADQLLLPLSLAEGESEYLTPEVTQHLVTNAAVIRRFLPVEIEITGEIGYPGRVRVAPAKARSPRG